MQLTLCPGHRLGDSSTDTTPTRTPNHSSVPINNRPAPSTGRTLGGNSPDTGRDAMLAAAEQRRLQEENRGVKESGKLSKQLAEQSKKPQPTPEVPETLRWD
ncbi:hypothetical protein J3Q64DRAFT_1827135 [Phycomyces blakesleeanus]|uniref:Uncharacterized protein n=1 Tax=Phycomyces blakesleeanus TaxID=4837 RepID=A0ABR3BCA7_PHYBL